MTLDYECRRVEWSRVMAVRCSCRAARCTSSAFGPITAMDFRSFRSGKVLLCILQQHDRLARGFAVRVDDVLRESLAEKGILA